MLNPNPRAIEFIEGMATKTRRNAMLGNVDSFKNEAVRNILNTLHNQVSLSIDVVRKIAKDESRTEVSKHHRAKVEAGTLTGAMAKARDGLRGEADKIEGEAIASINAAMALDPSRTLFASRKLDWLAKQYADPNGGSAEISKHVKLDPELGGLIWSGDAYILGMSEEARLKFAETAVKVHVPDAYAGIETAKQIRDTADKYDGVMKSVHSAFYIESVAAKIETRVE